MGTNFYIRLWFPLLHSENIIAVLLLSIMIISSSCKKDVEQPTLTPSPKKCLLKKITDPAGGGYFLDYNSEGLISKMTKFPQKDGKDYGVILSYSTNNKLINAIHFSGQDMGTPFIIEYNSQNLWAKTTVPGSYVIPGSTVTDPIISIAQYNSLGQLSKLGPEKYPYPNTYEYIGDDLSKCIFTTQFGDVTTFSYEFFPDNKNNLKDISWIFTILYSYQGNYSTPAGDKLIKRIAIKGPDIHGGTVTYVNYTYEFNEQGLITKMTEQGSGLNANTYPFVTTYEYTCE